MVWIRAVWAVLVGAALGVLALLPTAAFAYGTVPTSTGQVWSCSGATGSTAAAACEAYYGTLPSGGTAMAGGSLCTQVITYSISQDYAVTGQVGFNFYSQTVNSGAAPCSNGTTNGQGYLTATAGGSQTTCPANSAAVGGSCRCNTGTRPNSGGTQCEAYSCTPGALSFAEAGAGPGTLAQVMASTLTCVGAGAQAGCTLEYSPKSGKSPDGSIFYSQGSSKTNGQYCDGGSFSPASPAPAQDPLPPPAPVCGGVADSCPGTVNGTQVCVPCQKATADGPTQTASAPAGKDLPTIPGAPPGTVEVTSSTSCTNGSCTTTIIYKGADGQPLGEKKEEKPQVGFCEENKGSPLCKDKSFGAAACGSVPACEGDAIQCAIAAEQHRANCAFEHPSGAAVDAGVAGATGDSRPAGHPGLDPTASAIAFSSAIDQSDGLGGGSCPGDQSISVAGRAVVIPWSKACSSFGVLKLAVVGFSMLAAAFIVFRS